MKIRGFSYASAIAIVTAGPALAADCEVTHWWTSGGEAAAVKVFAESFNALGEDKWVDGAIGGSDGAARPIIISRISGGNPPCATFFSPGPDANDFVDAGLMLDLTPLAEEGNWDEVIRPASALDGCRRDGKIWCVPVTLHSSQWMYTNRKVFEDAGIAPPKNLTEVLAAAPALREKGIIPISLGQGWPIGISLGDNVDLAALGRDGFIKTFVDRDVEYIKAEGLKSWQLFDQVRQVVKAEEIVPQWNDAVNQVIQGKAAANIHGDWAKGEFALAGLTPGVEYDCVPNMGMTNVLDPAADVFYFPKQTDPAIEAAQLKLAAMMMSAEVQVPFNLAKGGLPVRGDVDVANADACMKIGLEALATPEGSVPQMMTLFYRDTVNQIEELRERFMATPEMTPEEAHAEFVSIIENAPAIE